MGEPILFLFNILNKHNTLQPILSFKKYLIQRKYGQMFSTKHSTVQPIFLLLNILIKSLAMSIQKVFLEILTKKSNSSIYLVFQERKILIKVQYTSIFIVALGRKILVKRQNVPTHFFFLKNVDQKVLRFNPDCLFRRC